MAILNVPSQYSTINDALTAASAGDDIVVDGGTYAAITVPASKSNLRVRAKRGTSPVVSGTGALITIGSGSEDTRFEGLRFVRTGTNTTSLLSTLRQVSFVDCVFDCTGWNQTVGVTQWIQSRATNGAYFRRCRFVGGSGLACSQVLAVLGAETSSYIVEGCVFDTCSASVSLILDRASTPLGMVVRNNTFLNCTVDRNAIDVEGTNYCAIYNNVFRNLTLTAPGGATAVLLARLGALRVSNNIIHNVSGVTTNLASPDSGNNTTIDPLLDSNGRPTAASPCVGAGIALSGLGERRVHLGYGRRSFRTTPDIGAIPARRGPKSALYRKVPNVDILSGVTFNMAAQGDITPPASRETYQSPWETALALEHALTVNASRSRGPIEIWYDEENDRYRMASYLDTFNLSIAGASAKVFGAASLTGISDTG